jgi:hypothetical protein
VLLTEGHDVFALRIRGDSVRAEPLALPFPVRGFGREGDRVFASAAGEGIAEYIGGDPIGVAVPRARAARIPGAAVPLRTASPLFRAGPGPWFDAAGKIRSR